MLSVTDLDAGNKCDTAAHDVPLCRENIRGILLHTSGPDKGTIVVEGPFVNLNA
jgi:hypothetical protein